MATMEYAQSTPQHSAFTAAPTTGTPLPVVARPSVHHIPVSGRMAFDVLLDVAHELRSPLHSFRLSLDVLTSVEALPVAEVHRLVHGLQRSAINLQTLIENMLDAAGVDAAQFGIAPDEVDLAAIVDESILTVEPLLAPTGQAIRADLPPQGLLVHADSQRVRQVLVNLLHNAIKYGPRAEAITVRASREGPMVLVEVSDRGPGIPPDEQPHLFERFYRGRTSIGVERGSGLGLAIARSIVYAHGGTIGLRSGPGQGTTFWFTLPGV